MAALSRRNSYRFTFGPWNISTGQDPFGPPVRKEVAFAAKVRIPLLADPLGAGRVPVGASSR